MSSENNYKTIVIGGGQAGLSAGYFLASQGQDFIILDENRRPGDAWRKRWDSLRLFTPTHMNHLPGLKYSAPPQYFPTKDETADYLGAYASQFQLPVRFETRVDSLTRSNHGYHITAGEASFDADNVIVATGPFQRPYTPGFAQQLDAGYFQLHSADYRRPGDVPGQNVVIAGAGNSGSEIALELANMGKHVWLAGRDVGRIALLKFGKLLGGKPLRWITRHVLTTKTPVGRKMQKIALNHGSPLGRIRREELAAAGVEFASRVASASDGKLYLEDGSTLPAENIIWATGYRRDYSWIKLPVIDENGRPRHVRGLVPQAPGLFFLGLPFQTGLTSTLLGGVGVDAHYITRKITSH